MKKKNVIILVVSILIVVLIIMGGIFIGIPAYLNYTARKTLSEFAITHSTTEDEEETSESIESQLENQEQELFNQKFISYETEDSETISATTVKSLFSLVANSNEVYPDRIVDVNGTIITSENLESLYTIVTSDMKYKIKCVLDDDGYVKTIELRYVTD